MADRLLATLIRFFSAEWSGALLAVLVLSLAFGVVSGGDFLAPGNLMQIVISGADIGLIAAGMTIVILTAGIDLSVGSILVLVTSVMGYVAGYFGLDPVSAIFVGLATGILVGCFQGLLIAQIGMPAFIVTLAGLSLWRGLANFMTKAQTSPPLDDFFKFFGSWNPTAVFREPLPDVVSEEIKTWGFWERLGGWLNRHDAFSGLSGGQIFEVFWLTGFNGLQMAFFIHIGFFILIALMLNNMKIGRYMYAIGSNESGARQAGINTKQYLMMAYIICGLCCAMAGVVRLGLSSTATPLLGSQYELLAIAAVVIGGTSLFGGRGTIWGTFLGVLLLKVINNGFIQSGLAGTSNEGTFVQMMLTGVIIMIAVGMDIVRQNASIINVQRFLCGAAFACMTLVVLAPGFGTVMSAIALGESSAMKNYQLKAEEANAALADEIEAAKRVMEDARALYAPFEAVVKEARKDFNAANRRFKEQPGNASAQADLDQAREVLRAARADAAETEVAFETARLAFNRVNSKRWGIDQKQKDRILDAEAKSEAEARVNDGIWLLVGGLIALVGLGVAIWMPISPITVVAMLLTAAYSAFTAFAWSVNLVPLAVLAVLLLAGVAVVPYLFYRARDLTKQRLGEA
ncbi:MAG: ABC transporter permease subunit [Alphaproteobacteria bacterium]